MTDWNMLRRFLTESEATSEGKSLEAIERAEKAKLILEDELVVAAFADLEDHWHGIWEETKTSQKELREDAWMRLKCVGDFKKMFEAHIREGKRATSRLANLERTLLGRMGRAA